MTPERGLSFVYADAADPATPVVVRPVGPRAAERGTCAFLPAGPAWVIDRDHAGELGAELELERAAAGIVLPRIVLVTRGPVRLV